MGCNAIKKGQKKEKLQRDLAEYLTRRGAMRLANKLQLYWSQRGYPAARFWPEPIEERFDKVGTYEVYRVMSNLVNGKPPVTIPERYSV